MLNSLCRKQCGEFGKSKNSDIANKVINVLERATRPMSIVDIWKQVQRDLPSQKELIEIVSGLAAADRVQSIHGAGGGFLPKKQLRKDMKFVDWSMLTQEEQEIMR